MTLTLFGYDPTVTVSTLGGTFTRADASTCATYVDANGVVQTVAANVLRNSHYVNGVRTTLLEGSRQNIVLRSESLANAAWVDIAGTGTATDGGDTSCGISLSTLNDTSAVDEYVRGQTVAFTGDGVKAITVHIKKGTATTSVFAIRDTTAPAWRLGAEITWTGSVPSINTSLAGGAGNLVASTALAGNVYRLTFLTSSVTAANTNKIYIYPADTWTGVSANTGTLLVGGVQAENAAFPSSYIPTGAAAVTRAADALSFPFLPVPQAMTVYAKMIDVGESTIGPSRTGSFGNIGSTNAESFYFSTPNGKLSINHIAAAGSGASTQTAAVNAAYDTVEALGSLSAAGVPQLTYSFNGAAEVSPAAGTARALDAAWNATTVWLTGQSAAATTFYAFQKLVIASGVQSLATMRTLSATGSGATVTNTLAQVAPAAEIAAFGQPGFTCMDSGTNTALSAAYTPPATQQARLFTLTVDYSAAPAAGPITVQDGETVLWRYDLSATGPFQQTFDFTRKPLRASKGAVLSVNAASPGSGVQGMITWTGDVVRAP